MEQFFQRSSGILVAYVLKAKSQKLVSSMNHNQDTTLYYTYTIQLQRLDKAESWTLHRSGDKFIQLHNLLQCYFEQTDSQECLPQLPVFPKFKIQKSQKKGRTSSILGFFLGKKKRKDSDQSYFNYNNNNNTIGSIPSQNDQSKMSINSKKRRISAEADDIDISRKFSTSTNPTTATSFQQQQQQHNQDPKVYKSQEVQKSMKQLQTYINKLISKRYLLNFDSILDFFNLRRHAQDVINKPTQKLLSYNINLAPNPPNQISFCAFEKDKNIVILGINSLGDYDSHSFIELRWLQKIGPKFNGNSKIVFQEDQENDKQQDQSLLWGCEYKDRTITSMNWCDKQKLVAFGFSNGSILVGKIVPLNNSSSDRRETLFPVWETDILAYHQQQAPIIDLAIQTNNLILYHLINKSETVFALDINFKEYSFAFNAATKRIPQCILQQELLKNNIKDQSRCILNQTSNYLISLHIDKLNKRMFISNQQGFIFIYSLYVNPPTYYLTLFINLFPMNKIHIKLKKQMRVREDGTLLAVTEDNFFHFFNPKINEEAFSCQTGGQLYEEKPVVGAYKVTTLTPQQISLSNKKQRSNFRGAVSSLNLASIIEYSCSADSVLWSDQKHYIFVIAGDNGIISFIQEKDLKIKSQEQEKKQKQQKISNTKRKLQNAFSLLASQRASKINFLQLMKGGMLISIDINGEFSMWKLPNKWRDQSIEKFQRQFLEAIELMKKAKEQH